MAVTLIQKFSCFRTSLRNLRTVRRSSAVSCRKSQPSSLTSNRCASTRTIWSRRSSPSTKRWRQIWLLPRSREISESRLTSLTSTRNSSCKRKTSLKRLSWRPRTTRTCRMTSRASKMKTAKEWPNWSVKRTRRRLRRICTFSTWSVSCRVRNHARTACTRRKRRSCRRRLSRWETCWPRRKKWIARSRCIWRSVSPSYNNSTKTKRLRKTQKLHVSRLKETKSRRGRHVRTKRSNRSLKWSKSTPRSARSARRSKTRKRRKKTPRFARRCPWRTPLATSNAAGFGSKPRVNSSPKRAKRAGKARKRRRSDQMACREHHELQSKKHCLLGS